jgi:hypothetical protein
LVVVAALAAAVVVVIVLAVVAVAAVVIVVGVVVVVVVVVVMVVVVAATTAAVGNAKFCRCACREDIGAIGSMDSLFVKFGTSWVQSSASRLTRFALSTETQYTMNRRLGT